MDRTLTYGDLEHGLERLGFVTELGPNYKVYRNAEHDALVAVPAYPDDEPLQPVHFVAARHSVIAHGVASEKRFVQALTSSELPARQPTVYHLKRQRNRNPVNTSKA